MALSHPTHPWPCGFGLNDSTRRSLTDLSVSLSLHQSHNALQVRSCIDGTPDRHSEVPPGGVGHAGLRHFFFDAGEGFFAEVFLSLLRNHLAMVSSRPKQYSSI
jgi:hypothetical protein